MKKVGSAIWIHSNLSRRHPPIAFAGAGCPRGAVIGATDKQGGDVTESLHTPYVYAGTIYRKLGLTADARLTRPDVAVNLSDGGKPISELF